MNVIGVNPISIRIFVVTMGIVYLMIMASVTLALVFLVLFIVGAKNGQFDEDESPAVRILKEDKLKKNS